MSQNQCDVGNFDIGQAIDSTASNIENVAFSPLQSAALEIPSNPAAMRSTLDSVNPSAGCGAVKDGVQGFRDFQAALLGSESELFSKDIPPLDYGKAAPIALAFNDGQVGTSTAVKDATDKKFFSTMAA